MRGQNLFAACSLVVAGLPREDKEKLLTDLAREFGYTLQPQILAFPPRKTDH